MSDARATLTFRAAAEHVLAGAGTPLTATDITERALAGGLLASGGKTPAATMEAQLATSIQQHGGASPFIRVAPRTYALRRWVSEGRMVAPEPLGEDVRIVFFPDYASVRIALPVLAGMTRARVNALRAAYGNIVGRSRKTPTGPTPTLGFRSA